MSKVKRKIIGSYCICNTLVINVYAIDHYDDQVLAGVNDKQPEWYPIEELAQDQEVGFRMGQCFVPFSHVMRSYKF